MGTEVGSGFFTLCHCISFLLYSLVFFDIDKIFFFLISRDDFFYFFFLAYNSFFFMSSSLHCCVTADWLKPVIRDVIPLWFKDSRRWRTLHFVPCLFQCVITLAAEVMGCDEAALTVLLHSDDPIQHFLGRCRLHSRCARGHAAFVPPH